MLYLDYNWDLSPRGIMLDDELDLEPLGWKDSDVFVLRVTQNGRAMLEKQNMMVVQDGQSS